MESVVGVKTLNQLVANLREKIVLIEGNMSKIVQLESELSALRAKSELLEKQLYDLMNS
jgi:hypothetical protein